MTAARGVLRIFRVPKPVGWVSGISVLISVGAVAAALVTTIILLAATGNDPGTALNAIADGALSSSYALSATVAKTVPRLLAASASRWRCGQASTTSEPRVRSTSAARWPRWSP